MASSSAALKCSAIIVEAAKGGSSKMREFLQGKGLPTYLVKTLEEAGTLLSELMSPMLIVDLPDTSAASKKFAEDLMKFELSHNYPLFVIGSEGPQMEEQLTGAFKLVTGIRKPVSNMELFDAIKYTADVFSFPVREEPPQEKEPVETPASPKTGSPRRVPDDGPVAITTIAPPGREETAIVDLEREAHEIYSGFSSIPDLFFDQIDSYKLLQKNFNGVEYTHAINVSAISDKTYLPQDRKVLQVVEELNTKLPPWAQARLHRTSFMSHTIISHLTADEKLKEDARTASLLCNWSLANESKELLRKDYISSRSRSTRKDVCSRMKDSAMKIAFEMNLSDVGNMVAKVGRLVGKEETVDDDPVSVVASAIAAADMIDRTCWHSHYFNPRAAYRVMYMAKAGQLTDIHPAVLCSVIKLLAEAIASSTQVFLVPTKLRNDPALTAEAKRNREQEVGENERKVSLNELTPGMRLSQPLVAFDGREILEEDLILDQDLIWRIWQLALIRPLNAPLIVNEEKPS